MSKPKVLFFARGYQADFFPHLLSDHYEAIYVTLTRAEKKVVQKKGLEVVACFEEDFSQLTPAKVENNYLLTSFMADRFLGRFNAEERIVILGKEVSFWRSIFNKFQPALVVNELVAIEISEVLLIESRRYNIKYLAGMNSVVYDYFYWLPNPLTISGKFFPQIIPSENSKDLAKNYLEEVKEKNYKPFYVKNLPGRNKLSILVKSLVRLGFWTAKNYFQSLRKEFVYENYSEEYTKRTKVFLKNFFMEYDRIERIPGYAEVIFYPLHQEPEATLNYMSVFYSNQCATIENILKCLNPNQVLVVKEHPVDKGALLQKKFMDLKKNYSGLYFLPAEVHGRVVLQRASRVVTLTSTVGWEALVLRKKVYVLGEIFYDSFPFIDSVSDFNELRTLLRNPIAGKEWTEQDIIDFVASQVELSYRGNPFPYKDLYSSSNIRNVVASIEQELLTVGDARLSKETYF